MGFITVLSIGLLANLLHLQKKKNCNNFNCYYSPSNTRVLLLHYTAEIIFKKTSSENSPCTVLLEL